MELQGSALELGKAQSPTHEVDKETVASLVISLIMASYNFLALCETFWSQVRACLGADVDVPNEEVMRLVSVSCCHLNVVLSRLLGNTPISECMHVSCCLSADHWRRMPHAEKSCSVLRKNCSGSIVVMEDHCQDKMERV